MRDQLARCNWFTSVIIPQETPLQIVFSCGDVMWYKLFGIWVECLVTILGNSAKTNAYKFSN